MNRTIYAAGACSATVAAALTFAGSALADPEDPAPSPGDTAGAAPTAAVELARLQAEGKSVTVVGADRGALLENCDVANMTEGEDANTVLLEVDCGLNYP
ncbi:hypothetical protein C6A85_000000102070 [Mycobacterium sp. ITM-2017-0098]|nr:hypothetical protein C6A85_000000102070 [Mycobacterium sp. ITM-2017-0098]